MKLTKLAALGLCLALGSAAYADTPSTSNSTPSSWSFNYSVNAKAFYDTNAWQAAYTPGLADVHTFGAAVGANIKATDKLPNGSELIFTYVPTAYMYGATSNLNYLNQTFGATEKFDGAGFKWNLNQGLVWVAGQSSMPVYNDNGTTFTPGFTAPAEQARTNQLVWTETSDISKTWDKWLLEFRSYGIYQNFESYHSAQTGFSNCTDRYDLNAGADVGYEVFKNIYALGGFRVGDQWQGINPATSKQYTNDYARLLAGVRGKLPHNITIDVLAGPEFAHYYDSVASTFHRNQSSWWYQGTAGWDATKSDNLAASVIRWNQMASTGGNDYQDAITSLKYTHKFNSKWSADVTLAQEYRSYLPGITNATQAHQSYTLYYPTLGVNFVQNKNLSYRAAWTWTNCQADNPKATGALADAQEFHENNFSVQATYTF
jgi:hypothetical protein